MKNWYAGMTIGQKIFLFLVTAFIAFIGIGIGVAYHGSSLGFLLIFPLLLLIYLALGGTKKTTTQ